jgi:bifunctional N-acetylglucosamine-1-phosphate-uridyltransferase/glucosamine-1-phosphate-acetyltransferase GlmU-like protein
VGERVNYGAGSITANYDGANKHRTVIEADVHVGSNCVLVAPVTIGAGGTVGGGSTISKNTPPGALKCGARQAGEPGQLEHGRRRRRYEPATQLRAARHASSASSPSSVISTDIPMMEDS